jgi:hypothetical protein
MTGCGTLGRNFAPTAQADLREIQSDEFVLENLRLAQGKNGAALDVDPNDGKTHYLYARAGNMSDAFSEIQIALRLRPGQREFEDLYELIRRRSK